MTVYVSTVADICFFIIYLVEFLSAVNNFLKEKATLVER